PNVAPATVYVAIPPGSSSDAPVTSPGPSFFSRSATECIVSAVFGSSVYGARLLHLPRCDGYDAADGGPHVEQGWNAREVGSGEGPGQGVDRQFERRRPATRGRPSRPSGW